MLKNGPLLPYEFEDIKVDPYMVDLWDKNLKSSTRTSIVSAILGDRLFYFNVEGVNFLESPSIRGMYIFCEGCFRLDILEGNLYKWENI